MADDRRLLPTISVTADLAVAADLSVAAAHCCARGVADHLGTCRSRWGRPFRCLPTTVRPTFSVLADRGGADHLGACRPVAQSQSHHTGRTGILSVAANLRWLPTFGFKTASTDILGAGSVAAALRRLPTVEFMTVSPTSCSSGQLRWPPTPSCPGALSSDFEIWTD